MRHQRIDELTRRDHYFLGEQDVCYYFLEYSARNGQSFGAGNGLVRDLLRPESKATSAPDVGKQRAVRGLAHAFKAALRPERLGTITFVPIPVARPPERTVQDDRTHRILRCLADGLDVRDLIGMVGAPGDFTGLRTGPEALYEQMRVVPALLEPAPSLIVLVGDVLTTGASYVAARRRLQQSLPYVPVFGLFAARKLRDADDIANLNA